MKKYIFLSAIAAISFAGCVEDKTVAPSGPTPENYEDIVINEMIAKDTSDVYFTDESGNATDWVELYNKGNKAINVAGMFITDDPGVEAEYQQIPENDAAVTTIPPKGFLVLICGADDVSGVAVPTGIINGKVFIDMGLSASKDNFVSIYNPEKLEIDISDDFNGLEDDKSFGRTEDASLVWATLTTKTPNAPNDGSVPVVGTIVINEFMASNDLIPVPGDNGDFPDWIELYNTGDNPIDVSGWYASDDLTDLQKWQLPAGTTIPGHGYLILFCDGTDTGLHTNFKLSSGGEDVAISEDGTTLKDGGSYCATGCDYLLPPTDNSCGRDGDGVVTPWIIYGSAGVLVPTPGASNK